MSNQKEWVDFSCPPPYKNSEHYKLAKLIWRVLTKSTYNEIASSLYSLRPELKIKQPYRLCSRSLYLNVAETSSVMVLDNHDDPKIVNTQQQHRIYL